VGLFYGKIVAGHLIRNTYCMAEIITGGNNRSRLQPPRIDLTPMVDLGFLLITFFMFTTTLAKSKSLVLNNPVPTNERPNEIPEESTLTLIPVSGKTALYYNGAFDENKPLSTVGLEPNGVRKLLRANISSTKNLPATYSAQAHKLHVLIKPNHTCPYNALVSLLDEMLINDVPYYVVVDISAQEQNVITNKLQLGL
jgi:biopolymer transport protein ExbD